MTKKTPEENFIRRWNKDRSVIKQVYTFTKPRKSWDQGINFKDLKYKIEISLKKTYCDGSIYKAISHLNIFGKKIDIYIRSSSNRNDDGKIEHRYYIPSTPTTISDEETDLGNKKDRIEIKEKHLEYHRDITIPQEKKLAEIQR